MNLGPPERMRGRSRAINVATNAKRFRRGNTNAALAEASSLFGVGKHEAAKRRYSAVRGGGSQRAVLVLGFERGSDGIAVAAVGMWKSVLWAISKGGGKRVKTAFGFPRFPRPVISTVDFGAEYASSPVAGKL